MESDPEKQLKYLDFIDIYAALEDNERARYQRDYPQETKIMSRFAERFREEGMQQGMQQGLEQGMQRGEALVLERLLQLKVGTLPETVQQRIEQANERPYWSGPNGSLPLTVSTRSCTEPFGNLEKF